jgi:hypothetical protein
MHSKLQDLHFCLDRHVETDVAPYETDTVATQAWPQGSHAEWKFRRSHTIYRIEQFRSCRAMAANVRAACRFRADPFLRLVNGRRTTGSPPSAWGIVEARPIHSSLFLPGSLHGPQTSQFATQA